MTYAPSMAEKNNKKPKKATSKKPNQDPTKKSTKTKELNLGQNEVSEIKKKRKIKVAFNGLTPKEWTIASRNVWADLSSPRHKRHLEHGAVFPLKLAERVVSLYSGAGDLVFDPFAGIGTSLVASKKLGRNSIGIELNSKFIDIANNWFDEEANIFSDDTIQIKLINDDCRNMGRHLEPNSVQATVTSPPYANFIQRSVADRKKTHKSSRLVHHNNSQVKQYSNSELDFGNLDYEKFLDQSEELFEELLKVTKPNGYAIWVVKDYRLPPKQPYISMHSDLAARAQKAGWLWHDLIVWDQNEQRSLVLLGFPTRFYTNQNCSFLVVLRKNDK